MESMMTYLLSDTHLSTYLYIESCCFGPYYYYLSLPLLIPDLHFNPEVKLWISLFITRPVAYSTCPRSPFNLKFLVPLSSFSYWSCGGKTFRARTWTSHSLFSRQGDISLQYPPRQPAPVVDSGLHSIGQARPIERTFRIDLARRRAGLCNLLIVSPTFFSSPPTSSLSPACLLLEPLQSQT